MVVQLAMADTVIRTEKLCKEFGATIAVKGLDLEVRRGEVFAFLGLNGAGKTTSLKMLLGLVFPTSGRGMVLGRPLGDVPVRQRIGFLPEHFRFHDWLTAAELLNIHGRLYGLSSRHLAARVPMLLELIGLAPFAAKRLQGFSKGMLQRIGLALALLNEPEMIFLDEPTSGLDPAGRLLVRDIINDQRQRGTTIFLNSHLLSEVEVVCDRAAFIRHGEVIEVRELGGMMEGELSVAIRARQLTPDVIEELRQWGTPIRADGERLQLRLASESVLPEVIRHMVLRGVELYAVTPQRQSLEELFIRIVGTEGGL